jgi:hypothetical protein
MKFYAVALDTDTDTLHVGNAFNVQAGKNRWHAFTVHFNPPQRVFGMLAGDDIAVSDIARTINGLPGVHYAAIALDSDGAGRSLSNREHAAAEIFKHRLL